MIIKNKRKKWMEGEINDTEDFPWRINLNRIRSNDCIIDKFPFEFLEDLKTFFLLWNLSIVFFYLLAGSFSNNFFFVKFEETICEKIT